jgi:hypothetical protein
MGRGRAIAFRWIALRTIIETQCKFFENYEVVDQNNIILYGPTRRSRLYKSILH